MATEAQPQSRNNNHEQRISKGRWGRGWIVGAVLATTGLGALASCGEEFQRKFVGRPDVPSIEQVDVQYAVDREVCDSWRVRYSLVGSEIAVSNSFLNLGDGVNYMDTGHIDVRYKNVNDAPGDGPTSVVDFSIPLIFDMDAFTTDFMAAASTPDGCPVATGRREGDLVHWETPVFGVHTTGPFVCKLAKSLCTQVGFKNGHSTNVNRHYDQTLNAFDLQWGTAFLMGAPSSKAALIPEDKIGKAMVTFWGTEVSRTCEVAPKNCPAPADRDDVDAARAARAAQGLQWLRSTVLP